MKYIMLVLFPLFSSCATYCYRAYIIPDATLSNPIIDSIDVKNNSGTKAIRNTILLPHQIEKGNNIILMYRGLHDNQLVRDDEYFELITVQIPKDSLKQEGEIKVGCQDCATVMASIGGIQWLESSWIGRAITGKINYKYLKDGRLWAKLKLELQMNSTKSDPIYRKEIFNNEIIFSKSNTNESQMIPDFPCPRIN